jgi:hypothetical protein
VYSCLSRFALMLPSKTLACTRQRFSFALITHSSVVRPRR